MGRRRPQNVDDAELLDGKRAAVLASILASFLIPTPEKQVDPTMEIGHLRIELAAVHEEPAAIRKLLTIDKG